MAVHPSDGSFAQQHGDRRLLGAVVYLMCDDVEAAVRSLSERNVSCSPVVKEQWGLRTTIPLPSGGELGLYQPTHPTALGML
jgi:hypothetical protein